jgi:hypothetical protein
MKELAEIDEFYYDDVCHETIYGCRILDKFPNAESQCQTRGKLPLDMIFTDIVGLIQFKRKVRNGYGKFR